MQGMVGGGTESASDSLKTRAGQQLSLKKEPKDKMLFYWSQWDHCNYI